MSDIEGLEREIALLTDDIEDAEKQNKTLKAENAALKKCLPVPVELPEPLNLFIEGENRLRVARNGEDEPLKERFVAKDCYDALRSASVAHIAALKAELEALRATTVPLWS